MIGLIPSRLRWMAVGAGVSYLSKRKAEQSVDRATEKLEEHLPEPLAKLAQALPAELLRTAGAVVAVGGAARTSASLARTTASATGTAISAGRTASGTVRAAGESLRAQRQNLGERVVGIADDLRVQSELTRRELKADYVRHTEGDGPGLEARLDLRGIEGEPIPVPPDPVSVGRRRFRPALPAPPVNRVQRSYRRPTKPWDR